MAFRDSVLLMLLALPWLNPMAPGPLPNVLPWLVAFATGVVLWLFRRELTPQRILQGWLLAAALSAVMGLLQYTGVSQGLSPWLAPARIGEAYGNLRQRNQFATLSSIGLTALLWLYADRAPNQRARRYGLMLMAMLLAAANAASHSRTGLLQCLLLLVIAGWGRWRQVFGRQLILASVLGYMLGSLMLPMLMRGATDAHGVWSRLEAGEYVCNSRRVLWDNVLHLIALKPWVGWGWGELDYAHFVTLYPGQRFCEMLDNAHNLPLHLAVELGVPVAVLFCASLAWVGYRLRPWREHQPDRQAAWLVLGLILLHSMVEYPLWYGSFQLAALLSAWVLCSASPRNGHAPVWRVTVLEVALAGCLLVAAAYAAWDYQRISQIYLSSEERNPNYREHTLENIKSSWLFQDTVRFAEFMVTTATPETAGHLYVMGLELLHYSPEPKVIAKLLDCATLLGEQDQEIYERRFQIAYPQEYRAWRDGTGHLFP